MKKTQKILYILFFLVLISITVAIIYLSFYKPILQDEGVFLSIAKGLKEGLLPYKDFFDHKPPGIYFLLLPMIMLLGKNILAFKLFLLVVNLVSGFFVYFISEKIRKGSGMLSALLSLFSLYVFEGYFLLAEPFMTLFLLVSLWLLIKTDEISNSNFLLSGIFSGLAILMKQPAIISVIVLIIFFRNKGLAYFFVGLLLSIFPVVAWLILTNNLSNAITQIIFANFKYPKEALAEIAKGLAQPLSATWFIWILFFGSFFIKSRYKVLLLSLCLLPAPLFLLRHYPHYWIQILPFVVILASIFFHEVKNGWKYFIIFPVLFSIVGTGQWFYWMYRTNWKDQSVEEKEAKVFLESLGSEYILAENRFTSYYFFSDKKPLTKFLYLTEVNESEEASRAVLKELKSQSSIAILWPNDNRFYAKEIDQYIKENIKKERTFPTLSLDIYLKD